MTRVGFFNRRFRGFRIVEIGAMAVLVALVLVISSVIGAVTIAAEFDRGTVRWAWTQSRSRQRWWRETTLVALASVIVLLTPLAVTMSWWLGATQYDSRYGTLTFLVGGWVLVPVAVSATVVTMVMSPAMVSAPDCVTAPAEVSARLPVSTPMTWWSWATIIAFRMCSAPWGWRSCRALMAGFAPARRSPLGTM